MAFLTMTHTFANSTTADATQVNTNFQDVIDALSDGTLDLNVNAATFAGALALNGNVTLGNASADDLTINASLASNVAIKTNSTYGIGSATLGLSGIYFGGTSTFTTRIIGAGTASYTITLPPTTASANQVLESTDGASTTAWATRDSADFICNYSLTATVAGNALTVALKTAAGSDATAANPVKASFRNATLTTGTYSVVNITGALSVVVSSGSTLGHVSATPDYVYVYLLNNAGTAELAVSSIKLDEGGVYTSVAEGGAGASDSRSVLYSTTARSNVAVRLIGRLLSTQATAGTWATAIAEISMSTRFEEPAMDDIHATKLGFKAYRHGFTYNGSNEPAVTLTAGGGTLSSVTYSRFIPRQMQDGSWSMSGNLVVALTSAARTSVTLNLAGNTTWAFDSSISGQELDSAADQEGSYASTASATNFRFVINHQSATTTAYAIAFNDIPLLAKPNWAY